MKSRMPTFQSRCRWINYYGKLHLFIFIVVIVERVEVDVHCGRHTAAGFTCLPVVGKPAADGLDILLGNPCPCPLPFLPSVVPPSPGPHTHSQGSHTTLGCLDPGLGRMWAGASVWAASWPSGRPWWWRRGSPGPAPPWPGLGVGVAGGKWVAPITEATERTALGGRASGPRSSRLVTLLLASTSSMPSPTLSMRCLSLVAMVSPAAHHLSH